MDELKKEDRIWYIYLTIIMFLWATSFPASKFMTSTIPPIVLSFLRYFFAVLVTIPFVLGKKLKKKQLQREDVFLYFVLGLIGIAGFTFLLFTGIKLSTATSSSIIVNSQVIFIAFLSPLLIGEKFSQKRVIGALIGICGLTLVIANGEDISSLIKRDYFVGDILLILASIFMCIYSIYMKGLIKKYGSLVSTFYTMIFGLLVLLACVIVTGKIDCLLRLDAKEWIIAAYIGAVPTAFVYIAFNKSLKIVGVTNATSFKLLMPVFAIMLSVLLIGEKITSFITLGLILIILGILSIQSTQH
ncbi:MAG: DMT family transporter [Candidatus Methanofastidiosia archaeon]